MNKSIDWNRLIFGDMIDAREGVIYETQQSFGEPVNYFDFSAGAMIFTDYFFGGFVVDHLTEPAEGLLDRYATSLPRKYTFHAGANIPLGKMWKKDRGDLSEHHGYPTKRIYTSEHGPLPENEGAGCWRMVPKQRQLYRIGRDRDRQVQIRILLRCYHIRDIKADIRLSRAFLHRISAL